MATCRRRPPLKWQPLAPPTPRRHVRNKRGTRRLEALFDEDRVFGKDVVWNAGGLMRRDEEVAGVEAEMLRAECRFLRMERELALKKVKRNRSRMERVLRSAMQTLISGRDKVAGAECGIVCESLDEEIEAMRSKLADLHRVSRTKLFEAEATLDDHRFPHHHIPREIQELAEASFAIEERFGSSRTMTVEATGLTKLCSATSTTSMPDDLASIQQDQEEGIGDEEQPCSGRCRAVVRRVAEQVRSETEQWSQVQEMLEKVKEEMEQLQASRDKWEQQALVSKHHIISLNTAVEAWKKRALSEEAKVNDLQTQVQVLQDELKMVKASLTPATYLTQEEKQKLTCQQKENHNLKNGNNRRQGAASREAQKQLEAQRRSPFLEIGNYSPLMRQITKAVFPNHRR